MKPWKAFLIVVMSVAILPFALIGVGQAQQMTCWCLKPTQTERKEHVDCFKQRSAQEGEDVVGRAKCTCHDREDAKDGENMGSCHLF
jgi:hypothetical protein